MTIIREGLDLTLISAVRLDEQGLKQLDSLGRVKHIVQLGAFHLGQKNGLDDPFYLNRYQARYWSLPGMEHQNGLIPDDLLTKDHLPISSARLFNYNCAKMPEALLLLEREGGILIAADSLQNWAEVDDYFSPKAAEFLKENGFIKAANIGPQWLKTSQPDPSDFMRLKDLPFSHLLPSHGSAITGSARQQVSASIDRLFPVL